MPGQRRRKSTKYLIADAVVFLTIISLMGHLGVNFWERYVLHSELIQMKSSLTGLKETLYTIENAYENLQKDLSQLADTAEQTPDLRKRSPGNKESRLSQDYQVQAVLGPNVEQIVAVAPETTDGATSNIIPCQYEKGKIDKNTTISTVFADAVTNTNDERTNGEYHKEPYALYVADSRHNESTSKNDRPTTKNLKNNVNVGNTGTTTRYPSKSAGAGTYDLKCDKEQSYPQCKDKNIQTGYKFPRELMVYNNDPQKWKF